MGGLSLSFSVLLLLHIYLRISAIVITSAMITYEQMTSYLYSLTHISYLYNQIPIWHLHLNISQKPQT